MRNPSDLFTPLTTDRFIIRVLDESDVTGTYLSWFNDEAVAKHIQAAATRQTLDLLRTFVREKIASSSALLLGIFLRSSGAHVGNIKFEPIDVSSGTAVVGVLIGDPEWRSRGAFREIFPVAAARTCSLFDVHAFWLGVDANNAIALQVYRKAGFVDQDHPPPELIPAVTPGVIYMAYRIAR